MTEVFHLVVPEEPALRAAEKALDGGELIVLPTDTVYGLAARPDNPLATEKLFEAKRRPKDLTIPVLVPDADDAADVATLDERGLALAAEFWPGGLTMILPRSAVSKAWSLGAATETVGVRVPDQDVTLALLARCGPLAVTSANISGRPTPARCEEVRAELGEDVSVYLCAGQAPGGIPSTIIDLTGERPVILREGAIPRDRLMAALGETG